MQHAGILRRLPIPGRTRRLHGPLQPQKHHHSHHMSCRPLLRRSPRRPRNGTMHLEMSPYPRHQNDNDTISMGVQINYGGETKVIQKQNRPRIQLQRLPTNSNASPTIRSFLFSGITLTPQPQPLHDRRNNAIVGGERRATAETIVSCRRMR